MKNKKQNKDCNRPKISAETFLESNDHIVWGDVMLRSIQTGFEKVADIILYAIREILLVILKKK